MASSKDKLTLLIDGDIIAYQAALVVEQAYPWDEEGNLWCSHFHLCDAQNKVRAELKYLKNELEADELIICLSDPDDNFRKDFMSDYKSNRKDIRKPIALRAIKEWMAEEFTSYIRPRLEADDVMGILATSDKIIKGDKIIVSLDKDMLTIPAKVFSLNRAKDRLQEGEIDCLKDGVDVVSEEEANRNHLYQTLIGDATDGYPGCPGVGPEKAKAILDDPREYLPYEYTFKRGKRKGETEIRYEDGEPCDVWTAIVHRYKAQGLTENDALANARVARILRNTDYNFKEKVVIPWAYINLA